MNNAQSIREFLTALMKAFGEILPSVNLEGTFTPGVSIAAYVLFSLGLFTIAEKRRIHNAWLAWVSVANLWLLGCISDQYRYVTRGQERHRRTWLLILGLVELTLKIALTVAVICGVGNFLLNLKTVADLLRGGLHLLNYAAWGLAVAGFGTVVLLIRSLALYDLYRSCLPEKKTLFLLLSILGYLTGLDLIPALLVFLVRNKESGMPPRLPE